MKKGKKIVNEEMGCRDRRWEMNKREDMHKEIEMDGR